MKKLFTEAFQKDKIIKTSTYFQYFFKTWIRKNINKELYVKKAHKQQINKFTLKQHQKEINN